MRLRRSAFVGGAALGFSSLIAPARVHGAEPPRSAPQAEQEASPKIGGTLRRASKGSEGPDVDTSFGRVDGDLAVVIGAGVTVGPAAPRGTGDLRLRYLDTVGIFGTYEDDSLLGTSSQPQRAIAVGAEVRPLFLARWLTGYQIGKSWLDLTIDSFGLEVGAVFLQPQNDAFDPRPGLQLGLGLEVPLLARANGPWVGFHGGIRWSDDALGSHELNDAADRAGFVGITLAWHQFFMGHAVDVGDRAPR
jgi:hypothetical protein